MRPCDLSPDYRKATGIYRITCKVNGFGYIGSAAGAGFARRLRLHVADLHAGKHHSWSLQRDWNRYGDTAFVFEVVEICTPAKCLDREQSLLNEHGVGVERRSYNICPVAGSTLGVKHTEQALANMRGPKSASHREALRRAHGGRPLPTAARAAISKRWVLTDPTGNEHTVEGLNAFCKANGLSQSALHAIANGRGRAYKGWHCRYEGEPAPNTVPARYRVESPAGEVYEVATVYALCKQNGLDVSTLMKTARGKVRAHKGWRCAFIGGGHA